MSAWLQLVLFSWGWRWAVVSPLAAAAILYTGGWLRLRRSGSSRLATRKRLAAYWGGLLSLAIGLMSFIDILGGQLLLMHMVQHLVLTLIAPLLIWCADPFPFSLWGLPPRLRLRVGGWFRRGRWVQRALCVASSPSLSWLLFVGVFLVWHYPAFYNLALHRSGVHDLQHLTFTGSALLFWWHIFPAGPRLHGRLSVFWRMGYLIAVTPPKMLLGLGITLAERPIYTYYTSVPRVWGLTVVEDQAVAGAIMLIPMNMVYMLAALLVLAGELREKEQPLRVVNR
jgi:cytochrome c oxidase assembly factor CtaG